MKNEFLDLIMDEPYKIAQFVGFEDFREYPHNRWLKKILFTEDDEYTLQAHRGSYKTTALSIAIALYLIVFPTKNIILIRKTDNDVTDFVKQVKNILNTDVFQEISFNIYGVPVFFTDNNKYVINTNLNQQTSGDPQFRALGINTSMTGKHADLVVTDDIITMKDRYSPAERNQTKAVYQEIHNIVNRDGRIVNLGTPWHENDAFELMSDIDKYDIYETGLIDEEEMKTLKRRMDPTLFSANYELKHIADGQRMFNDPVIDDGSNTRNIYNGFAHIDASYGGQDGSAFTIMNRHKGKIYVYGLLKDGHVLDHLKEFESKRKQYLAGTVYTETNADKGFLAKQILQPTKLYHESMNKHQKISTYLKSNWEDIIFLKDTDPNYIQQIVEYMEGVDHDDAPDSLASIIRETERRGGFRHIDL